MKADRLIAAASLALATSGVFAETGVKTYQIDNVANVYGRAGIESAQIKDTVKSLEANVTAAGRAIAHNGPKANVVTGDFDAPGRS